MTDKFINVTIEILGKYYPVRCKEAETTALQEAAAFLNAKMSAVQESGKAINLERIAIMTALNIAHELLQMDQQKNTVMSQLNQRILQLKDKVQSAINKSQQTELFYTAE